MADVTDESFVGSEGIEALFVVVELLKLQPVVVSVNKAKIRKNVVSFEMTFILYLLKNMQVHYMHI